MIVIDRYDPREDKAALKEIFQDFIENKSYFESSWEKFEKEIDKRALDLQYRNAMVAAREDGKLIGWGTFSKFTDYLGNERYIIHQVLTKKQDSFKKGIEEKVIRELQLYLKKTLKAKKAYYICPDSDSALRSLFLKLSIKKSDYYWYEKKL